MFAFVFESVGSGEWLVLLAVVLIVVGPKNLPSAARKMGQIMSKLRRAADEFKRQLMTMDEEMKRTADEIKRDYIDVPGESATPAIGTDETSSSDPGYDYAAYSEDPDHMGDYTESYPEDDTFSDEAGVDGEESSDPVREQPPAETVAASDPGTSPETPETTNGQDTRNTEEPGRG